MPAVTVGPLPAWLDRSRLLGPDWAWDGRTASRDCTVSEAADVAARLRGLGFGGEAVTVACSPPLPRAATRAARTRDAVARRDTTPGFDRPGTRVDEEGRWSLTPISIARALARLASDGLQAGATALDLTAGAGALTIALAELGLAVTAVDLHAPRLADARHNAARYGVAGRVRFVAGDAVDVLRDSPPPSVLVVDPPWGTEWSRLRTTADDLPLLAALLPHLPAASRVLLKLPPSFDPATLTFPASVRAWFGTAAGDRHRVKLVSAYRPAAPPPEEPRAQP